MSNLGKSLIVASVLACGFAAPAMAYPYHHYHHSGGYVMLGGGYPGPAYYEPYYPQPYGYYAPQPVYNVAPPPEVTIMPNVVSNAPGDYCREYQGHARINGVDRPTYGTACRQPDGSWKLIN